MLASWSSSSRSSTTRSSTTRRSICSRILTPKQVGSICWFMAIIVSMFYSQRSRKILLDAAKYNWDKRDELFKLLKHILYHKYMSKDGEDYRDYSDDTFNKVLSLLYDKDPNSFPYDPRKGDVVAIPPQLYIGRLYNLLNIDYKIFDYSHTYNNSYYTYMLAYSDLNNEFGIDPYSIKGDRIIFGIESLERTKKLKTYKYKENKVAPRILLIMIYDKIIDVKDYSPSSIISEGNYVINMFEKNTERYIEGNPDNLKSMRDTIYYNGYAYNLDSVVLANWNLSDGGHGIAGITCEKDKYVYNGWEKTNINPDTKEEITLNIPCELMKYDWNIQKDANFCLNRSQCIPEVFGLYPPRRALCFNFNKGNKVLTYVREEIEDKIKNLLKNKKEQITKTSKITDIDYIDSIMNKLLSMPQNINTPSLLWLLSKRRGELRKEKKDEYIRKIEAEDKKRKMAMVFPGEDKIKQERQRMINTDLKKQRDSLKKVYTESLKDKLQNQKRLLNHGMYRF